MKSYQHGVLYAGRALGAVVLAVLVASGCRFPPADDAVGEGSVAVEPRHTGSTVAQPSANAFPPTDRLQRAPLERLVELPRVGGGGGTPAEQNCGGQSVVVGMHGGAGDLIDSIAPICAELGDDATLDGDVPMDRVGGPGGVTYNRRCAPGEVVVGISGGAGDLVDRVAIGCLPIEDALNPGSDAAPEYTEAVGGDGGRAYEARCPAGSVVGGWTLGATRVLDSITVNCLAPAGSGADASAFVFAMADPSPDEFIGRLNVFTSHDSALFIDGVESTVESRNHAVELTAGTYEIQVVFPGGVISDVRTVTIEPYALIRVFFRRPEVAGP